MKQEIEWIFGTVPPEDGFYLVKCSEYVGGWSRSRFYKGKWYACNASPMLSVVAYAVISPPQKDSDPPASEITAASSGKE